MVARVTIAGVGALRGQDHTAFCLSWWLAAQGNIICLAYGVLEEELCTPDKQILCCGCHTAQVSWHGVGKLSQTEASSYIGHSQLVII